MSKDSLGDRMKMYENTSRYSLMRRMPLIIRVDGKAFHSLTRNMNRPFDDGLSHAMSETALYLCQHIQNCKLAYTQSDEISLLLTDYDRFNTESWFDRNLQKTVSVSAAMATLAFNDAIRPIYPDKTHALFDSRTFILAREEVCNYFQWRASDASRNSIQMVARANFSHKSLENLNCDQIQEKLFTEKNINWNDTPTRYKRGFCVRKIDGVWTKDYEIPLFNSDRAYINDLLVQEEE